MRDPTIQLLQICADLGLLALRDLFIELALLAGAKEFTAAEACAHAGLPENTRLRAAISAACGEVSPRKLGKILAKWEGCAVVSLRIDCVGNDLAGILWQVSDAKLIPERTPIADAGKVVALPPILGKRNAC